MAESEKAKSIAIGNVSIYPGEKISLALPAPEFYTCAPIHIPIHVLHGKKKGPVLVVCAAVYGDEINGIGIIQKLLNSTALKNLRGTLIAIPVMNIYGLIAQDRNLAGSGDLQKSFPGSEEGSFSARLARLLSKEIFSLATHCIILQAGDPRTRKWPQVYTQLGMEPAKKMAEAFQNAYILNSESKEGLFSLMYRESPVPTIIYATGEPMRLDLEGMKIGERGILRVMKDLEMIPTTATKPQESAPILSSVSWVLSHNSGICRFYQHLGSRVKKGTLIARITDPFSTKKVEDVLSPADGIVITETTLPIVNEGEPIVQIGQIQSSTPEPKPHE